jgi:PAS domain S-box-containing protein
MLLISVVSYQSLSEAREAADTVRRTQEVLAKLGSVLSHLLTAESEGRAFIITSANHHLKAYEAALPMIEGECAALRDLTAADINQRRRFDTLQSLVDQRLTSLKTSIETVQDRPISPRTRARLMRTETLLRERIAKHIADMEREEQRSLIHRSQLAETSALRATVIILGSNVVAALCLTLAGIAIWRRQTALQRTEVALRQEKEFAESLVETAPAIVVVLDREGRILRINAYLEELAGYHFDEVRGRDWFTVYVPERYRSRAADLYRRALTDEPRQAFLTRILTRDHRERTIQWFAKSLKDERGMVQSMLGIGHDATELKQVQRRALQAERLAAIGQMVTGLAHESRNALQRSQACLKMLAWEVPDRPKALELADRVQNALDDLLHLYEEVRQYAAPLKLALDWCDLEEIVQRSWQQTETVRHGRRADLEVARNSVDLHCQIDRASMGQVLHNILENALAASPEPVRIRVDWSDVELNGRPGLQIAVRDNGPGLTPEQRERIFEPFFTTKTHGTGLGMAIARRIVEAHQGRIAVSPMPQGAEIVVTLPREQS